MNIKIRLSLFFFLEFAVWGAYLISMGLYLSKEGLGSNIGWFYSVQGFVSLCMPALMGIVADKWIQAQRLLGLCHAIAGAAMLAACFYGVSLSRETVSCGSRLVAVSSPRVMWSMNCRK